MNNSLKTLAALAAVASLALAGCSTAQKSASSAAGTANNNISATHHAVSQLVPEVIDSLTGDWSVVEVGETAVDLEKLPTVSLSLPDSDIAYGPDIVLCYAFNGCNTINGKFKVAPGHKMAPEGDFISTLMVCPGVDYDQLVSNAVGVVQSYDLVSDGGESTLHLYDKGGRKMLTLRKHDLEFLNGAWRVTRLGDDVEVPDSVGMEMVIDLPEGKVHANGGCNVVNGKVEPVMAVDGGIRFTELMSTRMYCPSIELEQSLLGNLAEVAKAVRGGKPDTALLLGANGNVLVTLSRMDMADLRNQEE
ncbi:MAG: META domain-containing protein [Candidatus Amulumruptor caecigallinarius]|nr:META domain-containing protein [Candidatus Amulumruptor caecigallinarius]MCM1397072.1 META domain-containing protein [Candidatus Amulumruptor caecigallinarius]MCM1454058.1 META domain-containing protein [bacterium]